MPKDRKPFKLAIVNQEKLWEPLCRALRRPDLMDDPRFATIDERNRHMSELIAIFDEEFAKQDLAYWNRVFPEYDIPFYYMRTYDEIYDDPQMAASGVFDEIDHQRFGKFRTVDIPFKVGGAERPAKKGAPELGEHTREVLAAAGYTEDRIRDLLERGMAVQK